MRRLYVKIKDIPENERPVERLLSKGENALNNEELLAILLKTGSKDISAKELSLQILKEVGEIQNLHELSFERLKKIKGIGNMKAATILAFLELSKRINEEETIYQHKLNTPLSVFNYYKNKLKNETQEHFYVLYLNPKKEVIKEKLLFIGTLNQSIIHPREIFKEAFKYSAFSIICVHNHPSGNPMPSMADKKITETLIQIGKLMGIPLSDHMIIGKNQYYSFFEENPW